MPGKEEYLDSEKYEIKAWDFDRPGNISEHIRPLNRIRRAEPGAAGTSATSIFLNAWNDQILSYARHDAARRTIACSSSSISTRSNRQECTYEVPLWEFGLPDHAAIECRGPLQRQRLHAARQVHASARPARAPRIWR